MGTHKSVVMPKVVMFVFFLVLLLTPVLLAGKKNSENSNGEAFGKGTIEITEIAEPAGMYYHVFTPDGIRPGQKYPLVFALHGNGHNSKNHVNNMKKVSGATYPVFIVAPQYQQGFEFNNPLYPDAGKGLSFILKEVLQKYPIDENRVYLEGFSMGAGTACSMAYSLYAKDQDNFPFRALIMHSSGGPPRDAENSPNFPYLVFVGEKETAVLGTINLVASARANFNRLMELKKDCDYYEITGMKHTVNQACHNILISFIRDDAPSIENDPLGGSEYEAAVYPDVRSLLDNGAWGKAWELLDQAHDSEGLSSKERRMIDKMVRAVRTYFSREVDRIEKTLPKTLLLKDYERLHKLAVEFVDHKIGSEAKSALRKMERAKDLQVEWAAREAFYAAWDLELSSQDEGHAKFRELAAQHPEAEYGIRAARRVQALEE